jgi:LysM repeat protein
VLAVAIGVVAAGGLLLLIAHLSLGAPGARPAVTPGAVVTVQPGDTLWSIASPVADGGDVRAVVAEIRRLNGLSSARLVPGQTLQLP